MMQRFFYSALLVGLLALSFSVSANQLLPTYNAQTGVLTIPAVLATDGSVFSGQLTLKSYPLASGDFNAFELSGIKPINCSYDFSPFNVDRLICNAIFVAD